MKQPKHIAILGAGLAGSILGAKLIKAGHSITLFDDGEVNSASRIAGGIFNLITGRRMALTWNASHLFSALETFFSDPTFSGIEKYLHRMPVFFPFPSIGLKNHWASLPNHSPESKFANIIDTPRLPHIINNPLGGIEIPFCGWVDTSGLIKTIADFISNSPGCHIIQGAFEYSKLKPTEGFYLSQGDKILFDDFVFCEGIGVLSNPYAQGLPLIPLKGQMLELEINDFHPEFILSGGMFLAPLGGNRFLAGSTYEKQFSHVNPDERGRAEIEAGLKGTLKLPWKVSGFRAGIRPTTPDRRPFIGTHPDYSNLHFLNGLGSKGVLLAPWSSEYLIKIIEGIPPKIDEETKLDRYILKLRKLDY